MVYDNPEDILAQLSDYMRSADRPLRIGTGQYSDSLALDDAASFAEKLIDFFAKQDAHLLELKTKSDNVERFESRNHNRKTIFAWSVNPEHLVKSDEEGSVSLQKRLAAAKKCAAAGYPVGFHFDPIIYYEGWDKDYKNVVELIFSEIDPKDVAWISLGALRYHPDHKKIIKDRFPRSRIAFDELNVGEDGKIRYSSPIRTELFGKMREFIREHSINVIIYLCMENQDMWDRSGIMVPRQNPYYPYFKFFEIG